MNYFGVSARCFGPKRFVAFQYQDLSPGTRKRSSNAKAYGPRTDDEAVALLSHLPPTQSFLFFR